MFDLRRPRLLVVALGFAAMALSSAPALSTPAADPTPTTVDAIPLFQGLTLVDDRPGDMDGGGLSDWGTPYPLIEARVRTYQTTATPEEVFAFYQQRLGGKTAWSEADSHTNIGPGQATPVLLKRLAHPLRDTMNAATRRPITADQQRGLLQANRAPSSHGDWLQNGVFQWVVKDREGAPTAFDVQVVDKGVAPNWTGYAPLTTVTISVTRYGVIDDD